MTRAVSKQDDLVNEGSLKCLRTSFFVVYSGAEHPVVRKNYGVFGNDLQESMLDERANLFGADDEVIQHPDVHHVQGAPESAGYYPVGLAGLS